MPELPIDVVRFPERVGDPGATANSGKQYTKDAAGVTQLYYQDSSGTVHTLTPTPGANASAVLFWGNNSVSSTTTTRYLSPGFDQTLAQTSPVSFRVPRAGTIRNMYLLHNTGGGNGAAIVYTLRVNGAATALSVSLASTSTDAQDTVDTVAVVAGDRIDIEVTKAASVGTSPTDVNVTVEFV